LAAINEVARLTVEAIQKGVGKTFNKVGVAVNHLGTQVRSFNNVVGMNMEGFRAVNKQGVVFANTGAKLANRFRMLTHGARGFRMEMLGVMFFGMMIQKTFSNLLKPVKELYDIFELWRITLQILFLPLMDELFPYFLKFIEYLMELSPTTKKVIGYIVLFGVIIGGLIFLIGSVALGIGSMILAFGGMVGVGGTIGAISAAMAAIASVVAVVIAIIILAAVVWATNLGHIREHTKTTFANMKKLIKETLEGIVILFTTSWALIKAVMTGNWGEAWDKIKEIAKTAVEVIKNLGSILIHAFLDPLILKLNMVIDLFNRITGKAIPLLGGYGDETSAVGGISQINSPTTESAMSGGSKSPVFSPTYNINVVDYDELDRVIEENNKSYMDEVNRLMGSI